MSSLILRAQRLAAVAAQPGETVVDATAGNGHDSLFLAQRVGPHGLVYAVDVQESALEKTRKRLREAGCDNVRLLLADHAELLRVIPAECRGRVAAAMFNLGYLPGERRERVTTATGTLAALQATLQLLKPGGVATIVAYRGHPGGAEECDAVAFWVRQLPPEHGRIFIASKFDSPTAPRLFAVRKEQPLHDAPGAPVT